jgi:hypothetical protein
MMHVFIVMNANDTSVSDWIIKEEKGIM